MPIFRGLQPVQVGFYLMLFIIQLQVALGSVTRTRNEVRVPVPEPLCVPQGEAIPAEHNVNGPPGVLQGNGITANPSPLLHGKGVQPRETSFFLVPLAKKKDPPQRSIM